MLTFIFLAVNGRAEPPDITGKLQGTIKAVQGSSIKIIEVPNGKEERIVIDPNTVYDNVQKLTDLKAGDKVQIDYGVSRNGKTASTITKIEVDSF